MAGIGSVVIQFIGKDNLSRVAGNVSGAVDGVGRAANDATGKTKKLSGSLKAGVAVGASAALGALGALAGVMWEAGKAAVEDAQQADKLAASLERIPGITQDAIDKNADWIDSMELATHVADSQLRDAIGKLTLSTEDLGEAQKLTALAVDVAAESGKSLDTVTQALAKGYEGNTSQLKKLFPWLDAGADETLTFAEAQKQLTDRMGGAAKAAADRDPWTKMKVIWSQLSEELGGWLLPLVEELGDWFTDPKNTQAIEDIKDSFGKLSKQVGEHLVPALKDFLKWVTSEEGRSDMKRWAGYIESTASAVERLFTWMDKLANLNPLVLIDNIASKLSNIKLPSLPGLGGRSSSGHAASSRAAAPPTQAAVAQPATVLVTEEQVYRAVSRLMMRGDARNGRLQRVS